MVAMKPGKDGQPWELCSGCYLDGIRPMDHGIEKREHNAEPVSYELGEALKKAGWKVTPVPADQVPVKKKRKARG